MNGNMGAAMVKSAEAAPVERRRTMGVGRASVIRSTLDRLKIHPAELADFVGISAGAMENYLNGTAVPPYMIELACAGLISQLDNAAAARAFIQAERITASAPPPAPKPADRVFLLRVPPDKADAVAIVLESMKVKATEV